MRRRRTAVLASALVAAVAVAVVAIAATAVLGGEDAEPPAPETRLFRDVAREAGIRSRHAPIPPCGVNTTGAAWGDADGDRDLDLFLPQQDQPSELWVQTADGRFVERGERAGVAATGVATAAAFADYDNDGDQDLYVGRLGGDLLLRNDGEGAFADVSRFAGELDSGHTTSVAWADFDRDGDLDLHVGNGDNCRDDPGAHPNTLLRNEGAGTFSDASELLPAGPSAGVTLDSLWIDYDLDGDQDLYLGNDEIGGVPNALLRNDGLAGFADASEETGAGMLRSTMGIARGDVDRDGRPDLAFTDIGREALLIGRGAEGFADRAAELGFGRERIEDRDSITWGVALADLDNDGDEDAYAAAGALGLNRSADPDVLYLNDGAGRFERRTVPAPGSGRTVATADYDRDGDVDVAVGQLGGNPLLLENRGRPRGGWLELRLVGTASTRDACGALVTARSGGQTQVREVDCRSGDRTVHFGLGDRNAAGVSISWPSGRVQRVGRLAGGRLHTIREP